MESREHVCTIIVIYNDPTILDGFLTSLKTQEGVKYQLLLLDNCRDVFSGARQAYNSVLDQVEFPYVICCHPDIRFLERDALKYMIEAVEQIPSFGVVGVAGCPEGKKWELLSGILHGKERKQAGIPVSKATLVQTVDECFFVMEKEFLQDVRFSYLPGWHQYAVEQCLRAKEEGRDNYVIPAKLWHLSDGASLGPSYMKMLEVLIAAYPEFSYMNTTVKQWKTKGVVSFCYRKYYLCKQWIKQKIYR